MDALRFSNNRKGMLVLSFGAGQDSTTILYKLILDTKFRDKKLTHPCRNLVVVFADTGDEREATYAHAWQINKLCALHGIKFVQIASEASVAYHQKRGRDPSHLVTGFHTESWASLPDQYRRNHNLAIRNNKSCTDNLKIKPIYRWLDYFCDTLLDNDGEGHTGKTHIRRYAELYGNIEVMIGFTRGEERRVKKARKPGKEKWWASIDKTFPLADELGMDRIDCIDYMVSTIYGACGPSMCKMCPNITKQTLLLMWYENTWECIEWMRHEKRKLNKWGPIQEAKGKPNSFALGGKFDLIGELRLAKEKFKEWSVEDLREYDFRNGHCISNGY